MVYNPKRSIKPHNSDTMFIACSKWITCDAGFKCKHKVCLKIVGLGKTCGKESGNTCDKGFKCGPGKIGTDSQICHQTVGKGNSCGGNIAANYNICKKGLLCTNSTLVDISDIRNVINGICYGIVNPGQDAGSLCGGQTLNACKPEVSSDSATCFNGHCVLTVQSGGVCYGPNSRIATDPVCSDGLQCAVQTTSNGKDIGICLTKTVSVAGGPCGSSSETAIFVCKDTTATCVNGTCMTRQESQLGGQCGNIGTTNFVCKDTTATCVNGTCMTRQESQLGGQCGNIGTTNFVCKDATATCVNGTCMTRQISHLGGQCGNIGTTIFECADAAATCVNGKCMTRQVSQLGGQCGNSETTIFECADATATCVNGKCSQHVDPILL
jgi:hypothetical protein